MALSIEKQLICPEGLTGIAKLISEVDVRNLPSVTFYFLSCGRTADTHTHTHTHTRCPSG